MALAAGAASVEALNGLKLGSGETVDEKRRALIAKIGENMTVRRLTLVKAPTIVGSYVHTGNKKAALVALEGGDAELARDVAMHRRGEPALPDAGRCAGRPGGQGAGDRDRPGQQRRRRTRSKPAEIIAKIIDGKLRKSVDEIALGQPFVKNGDLTIDKLVKNAKASIKSFVRFEVGAGIEKKQDDFADEVMEQVKAAQKKDEKTDPPTKH